MVVFFSHTSLNCEMMDPQLDGPGCWQEGSLACLILEQDAQFKADDSQVLGVRVGSDIRVENLQRSCNRIILKRGKKNSQLINLLIRN